LRRIGEWREQAAAQQALARAGGAAVQQRVQARLAGYEVEAVDGAAVEVQASFQRHELGVEPKLADFERLTQVAHEGEQRRLRGRMSVEPEATQVCLCVCLRARLRKVAAQELLHLARL